MKKLLSIIIILVLAFYLVACGSGETTPPTETGDKTTMKVESNQDADVVRDDFKFVIQAEPAGFNPHKNDDTASGVINSQIYETLLQRSVDGKSFEPLLAESYSNPDPNTWIFKLREGVTFHDGTPFNAEAVKYVYELMQDPNYGAARASLVSSMSEINVLSEFEFEIKTEFPDGVMLAKVAHVDGSLVSPTAAATRDLSSDPVGTGAYRLVEYVSGSHIILEAYEDYWGDEVFMKTVRADIVPEISTAISRLETGETDFFRGVTSDHLSRVANMDNVKLVNTPSGRVTYLGVRTVSSKTGTTESLEARKAIAYAIDKVAFADTQNGLADPTDSIIGPTIIGFTDKSETYGYKFDMAKAQEMVKEYNLADKPLHILTSNDGNYSEIAEFVQASLLEAGFKTVEIEVLEWGAYLQETTVENRMDLFTIGWSNQTGDGQQLFYPNWHSDNIGGGNRAYYNNSEFEKYVDLSERTLDLNKRVNALDIANKLILEDAAVYPMYHGYNVYAYSDDIDGVSLDPGGNFYIKSMRR